MVMTAASWVVDVGFEVQREGLALSLFNSNARA
jgi:hypothetical protein